jgi:hypothetical protein
MKMDPGIRQSQLQNSHQARQIGAADPPFVACKRAMNGLENGRDPGFHRETLRLCGRNAVETRRDKPSRHV